MKLTDLLGDLRACGEASAWVQGQGEKRSIAWIYAHCERADWLLWIFGKMADKLGWPSRQKVVLAACACAGTSLKFVSKGEDRPRKAVETARKWAHGKATIEEVRAAADAAYAAAAFADAAYAAADADAADAAAAVAYFAYAAAAATYTAYAAAADAAFVDAVYADVAYADAAYAADAAAAAAAARAKHHKRMCKIIRRLLPCPRRLTKG